MAVNNDVTSVQVLADQVLSEIRSVLGTINEDSVRRFVDAILEANRIVVYGAGRMGMMSAAFGMRLAHLGFQSHVLREPTTPAIGEGERLSVRCVTRRLPLKSLFNNREEYFTLTFRRS